MFDELIPLAMMHEKLSQTLNESLRNVWYRLHHHHHHPLHRWIIQIHSPDSLGIQRWTSSEHKINRQERYFRSCFDSPSLRMDEELKKPVKLDETTLMSMLRKILSMYFHHHLTNDVIIAQKHNHPPPLPPRNNSSSDVKVPDLLNITRVDWIWWIQTVQEIESHHSFCGSTLGRETSATSTITLTTSYGNTRLTQEEEH